MGTLLTRHFTAGAQRLILIGIFFGGMRRNQLAKVIAPRDLFIRREANY
jgi:hypothetical protein